jgi:hypothetical protein
VSKQRYKITLFFIGANISIKIKIAMKKVNKVKKTAKDYRNNITGSLSKKASDTIINTNQLSLRLASVFDVKQAAVLDLAKRRSNKLLNITLVPIYKEFNLSEEDLTDEL